MVQSRSDYWDYVYCEFTGANKKLIRFSKSIKLHFLRKVLLRLYFRLTCTYTNEYMLLLRNAEYHKNILKIRGGVCNKIRYLISAYKLYKCSVKTGLTIPPEVCDKGLTIHHYGSIVINSKCTIGRNCCIANNVNIGSNKGQKSAPRIGDNVYIGPGAVIFGEIKIADNCWIGANAVVCKDILEPFSVVLGNPAKFFRYETKVWWEYNRLDRYENTVLTD